MFYIIILIILWKKQHTYPLKKRSPKLLMLSTLGNFLFCVLIMVVEISTSSCELPQPNENMNDLCHSKTFAKFICLTGFLLLTICEPLALLPYMLRSIRIYVIFRAQNYYFLKKRKPIKWFKWIKEASLIKVTIFYVVTFTLLSLLLFIIYLNNSKVLIYIPSYTVQACYFEYLGNSRTSTS